MGQVRLFSAPASMLALVRARLPRPVRYALLAVAGLLGIAIVTVGVLSALVIARPTEIGLIRDRIEATLRESLGAGYSVSIGRATLGVDPVLGLAVEATGIEVREGEGLAARVPVVRLAVDPLSLFVLRAAVTAVDVAGPEIVLTRTADGSVRFGGTAAAPVPAADPPPAGLPDLGGLMAGLDRAIDAPLARVVAAGLERVTVTDARIDVADAASGGRKTYAGADLSLAVAERGLTATVTAPGHGGRWTASLDRRPDPAGEHVWFVNASQMSLADFAPLAGDAWGVGDLPLYAQATVRLAADGAVASATARLDIGAGVIGPGTNPDEAVMLDEATVRLRWDAADGVVTVEPSEVFFGEGRAVFTGTIRPEATAGRYALDLESRGAIVAPRDSRDRPLLADRIAIAGVYDVPGRLFELTNLTIATPAGSLAAAGSLGLEGETPSLALAASFSPMAMAAFKQLWPPFIAGGARKWALENIGDGTISGGSFEAALPPGILGAAEVASVPADALRLDLRFENAGFATFGGLPPIRRASGNIVLAGSTFGVDLDGGEATVRSGEVVAVTAGAFAIDNVFQRDPEGMIEIGLAGSAKALGEIANAEPLLVLDSRAVSPSDLSGKATASVSVRVPLRDGVTGDDVDWKVLLTGTGLASKAPIDGRLFSKADVTIAVSPAEVTVKGKATIDGVPADVAITQPLTSDGQSAGTGSQVARLSLDQAARKRLGIGLDDILAGTVSALVTSLDGGAQRFDLDLRPARLTIPGLGWSKGIGVPAKLAFDLEPAEGGYRADNVVLTGSGFGLRGTARLNADYGLVSADIAEFWLREGDSLAFRLTATRKGYAIDAEGAAFDARGAIAELRSGEATGDMPDISLHARIDRVTGHAGEALTGAGLSVSIAGGTTREVVLSGAIAGAPLAVAYGEHGGGASLKATAGDAGAVLRFLDLYSRIAGGTLTVMAERAGRSGALAGFAEIAAFDVSDEPAMEEAATAARLDRGGAHDPRKAQFDRLIAEFRKTDRAIDIDNGLLRGSIAGAAFSGRFDLVRDRVAINGTYVPAYALNNAFSRVPILGRVLGGGSLEGLIGVTFQVEGPTDAPRAYFNPLSAVTPGIFRRIFEFR